MTERPNPSKADAFASDFNVSRETTTCLSQYLDILSEWNARINLVSRSSVSDAWSRHLADSAQLLPLVPPHARSWLDLGSGAGLPGLPVAIVAQEVLPSLHVTLVEADRRKVAFLRTVRSALNLDVSIKAERIEALPAQPFDVVSARGLAPLDELCRLSHRFKHPGTVFLFPKGAQVDSELTRVTRHWHIRADRIPSRTRRDATILRITDLEPRT